MLTKFIFKKFKWLAKRVFCFCWGFKKLLWGFVAEVFWYSLVFFRYQVHCEIQDALILKYHHCFFDISVRDQA